MKVYVQNQSGPSNGILHRFCLTSLRSYGVNCNGLAGLPEKNVVRKVHD